MWKPKGWKSLIGTTNEIFESYVKDDEPFVAQLTRVCQCERCTTDGQHEPMCDVHWEPPRECNCPRKDERLP